ncbi:hypothetical protein Tco_0980731 [Tanacetum coccineum]
MIVSFADGSDFYHEEFADELAHIISLSDQECVYFKSEPDPGELTSIVDFEIRENISSKTNVNLLSRNEDTIFDPGISIYHSFMPGVSHRSGTFMKFNIADLKPLGARGFDLCSLELPKSQLYFGDLIS